MVKHNLRCMPNAELEPTATLELAKQADLETVVVVGWRADGSAYISGSGTLEDANFLMDIGKREIMRLA